MTENQFENITRVGWYLDTSLLKDFIGKNIRTGFDTAEDDDGKTILHIKGNKSGTYVPLLNKNMSKRYAFFLTTTVNYLTMLGYAYGISFYYSELTKAEIYRSLRKEHGTKSQQEIVAWWDAFRFLMPNYQQIEGDFHIGEALSNLALDFPIRKNVQDYLHLIIAKQSGMAFITSDKLDNQIEEIRRNYYPHVYYWPDIKDKFPVPDDWKPILG